MTKIALITGGARGIGKAISKALSKDGWYLYIHCNNSVDEAKTLCEELGNAEYIQADLSQKEAIDIITSKCPEPNCIINNAGVSLVNLFDSVTEEEYRKMFEINLFAPMNLVRKLLPNMIRKKNGVIINISSVFGQSGGSCEVDYSTAKSGLIGFTKALAKEVGPSGIRVNCICPGIIDTEMNENLSFEEIEHLSEEIPLSRVGEPEDVADCVSFLVSDKARYITGSIFDVNGGWNG